MQNELCIVADAIKALREARGLTQEQLAEKADISVSHLAKIETHARAMCMKCSFMGISIASNSRI